MTRGPRSAARPHGGPRTLKFGGGQHIFRRIGRFMEAAMPAFAELLKASEASVVSHVSLRDVNRAIGEHILPKAFVSHDNGRRVWANACALIAFYYETAPRLTADERLHTIKLAEARLTKWHAATWSKLQREDWKVMDEFLTVDLAPFMRRTAERLADLEAARAMVTTTPEILERNALGLNRSGISKLAYL